MTSFIHDPDAVLPYAWDWTTWLAGEGDDTIDSHLILPADGITVDSSTHTDTAVTAWLSGGTLGEDVDITCRITTAGGRTDDRTITLQVRDR